jgi:hypothetical protein
MKTMNRLLIIGLVLFSGSTKAQNIFLPDEIWYNTGRNIYIQFSLPSIYDMEHFSDASKIFSDLYSESTQRQIKSFSMPARMSILLNKKEGETIITEKMNSLKYDIPEDLIPDSGIILQELKVVNAGDIKISCYFKNMDDLLLFLKNDWRKSVTLITAEFKKLPSWNKRKAIQLHYRQIGDSIRNTFVSPNPGALNSDELVLKGETGINSFKGKFLPDFTVGIGLMFSQKGILKNNYFLNYEFMYDFVSENGQSIPKSNHFIDAGYARNFTKTQNKADWYGISLGYLVKKNSDIFDDHTWRLSIYRNISKHIVLVPQMYFPNNFSKVFPGIKVKVSF